LGAGRTADLVRHPVHGCVFVCGFIVVLQVRVEGARSTRGTLRMVDYAPRLVAVSFPSPLVEVLGHRAGRVVA
jgi:hypothetical protein